MTFTALLHFLVAIATVVGALVLLKLVCCISLKLFKTAVTLALLIGCIVFVLWLLSL